MPVCEGRRRSGSNSDCNAEQSDNVMQDFQPVPVTVIMPIRNEANFIGKSLEAVIGQDYPPSLLEILVADGMSNDATRQIIARLAAAHPDVSISILDNPRRIVPTGFNLALRRARGEVIVRVDGHTIVAHDYVRQCVAALQRSGADNVGGRMEAVGENAFATAVSLATSSPFGVGGARFHYSDREEWVDTVYMGAWPRSVFERYGLFDEEQVRNQDDEFNYRLLERGGRILLSPRIRSQYFTRSSPRLLWRQYYQYGYWKVRVMQKHPGQMRPHQFVPAIFVAALSLCVLVAPIHWMGRPGLAATAGAYALANITASARIAGRKGLGMFPALVACFAILHVSYGLGFLVGLVKFRSRWADGEIDNPLLSPLRGESLDNADAH